MDLLLQDFITKEIRALDLLRKHYIFICKPGIHKNSPFSLLMLGLLDGSSLKDSKLSILNKNCAGVYECGYTQD